MNYILFFLCFLFFRAYSDYSALQLFLLATNPDDAAALHANIKPEDLDKSRPGKSKASKREVQEAIAKKQAAGAASGSVNCLTKAEAENIVKGPLPNIENATQAKAELVKFFDAGKTGGQLLKEIGATDEQVKSVKDAIDKINVKP